MRRLTTDEPKGNVQTALNLFYIKDHETWVRGGGPGPEYADVSLFDYTRTIIKTHMPDVELPDDNDNFSMMMTEWLFDGPESAEGVIATLYTAAWAFAELRHRLAAYEDTGLEPDICAEYKKFEDEAVGKGVPFSRIVELMEADKEGRLLVLPCKVGETLYRLLPSWYTEDRCVREITLGQHNFWPIVFYDDVMGRTVFRTREEAEAALERGKVEAAKKAREGGNPE